MPMPEKGQGEEITAMLNLVGYLKGKGKNPVMDILLNCCNPGSESHVIESTTAVLYSDSMSKPTEDEPRKTRKCSSDPI